MKTRDKPWPDGPPGSMRNFFAQLAMDERLKFEFIASWMVTPIMYAFSGFSNSLQVLKYLLSSTFEWRGNMIKRKKNIVLK